MPVESGMIVVAVDGPAGSGKGTVSRYLADRYKLKHLDTGLLYRYVALRAMEANLDPTDEDAMARLCSLCDFSALLCPQSLPQLRLESTASVASQIAVHPLVRSVINANIVEFAHAVASPYVGVILDGRDIGTVVFPNASLKLFITASPSVRAKRRGLEMGNSGMEGQIFDAIDGRDERDTHRSTAPLMPAQDAHIMDTTDMTVEEVCKKASTLMDDLLQAEAIF